MGQHLVLPEESALNRYMDREQADISLISEPQGSVNSDQQHCFIMEKHADDCVKYHPSKAVGT